MARGKKITKERFNDIKPLTKALDKGQRAPELRHGICKAFSISEGTLWRIDASDDYEQYREAVTNINNKAKAPVHVPSATVSISSQLGAITGKLDGIERNRLLLEEVVAQQIELVEKVDELIDYHSKIVTADTITIGTEGSENHKNKKRFW